MMFRGALEVNFKRYVAVCALSANDKFRTDVPFTPRFSEVMSNPSKHLNRFNGFNAKPLKRLTVN
jgi:hypothetical protein